MRCPNCQTENPERSLTCKACGVSLQSLTPPTDEERSRQLVEDAFRLSDEGKLAQAIVACRKAISANPNSTSAYSLLGILYERAGQREQAIQAYEAALRLSPESAADRESLRQLVSPPGPVTEAPRAVEVPAAPPAAVPVAATRRRWARGLGWSIVGALTIIVVVLLVMTLRAWRLGPGETSPLVRGASAPTAPVPTPVAPVPSPVIAGMPLTAAPEPALPLREQPPRPAAPVAVEPSPAPATTAPAPTVAITIPTPDAFILRTAPPPEAPAVPAAPPENVKPTPTAARARFFQGDVSGAIRIYEAAVADKTQATPEAYQEMGWLYYEAGRATDAAAAYRQSLERYQQQLTSGQDVEAARHGIRTAEAALKVLELE
jgi:tetratricopeptide (TPR) repeat protein